MGDTGGYEHQHASLRNDSDVFRHLDMTHRDIVTSRHICRSPPPPPPPPLPPPPPHSPLLPSSVSPNSMPGVDAMISTLAHELTETVTDPYGKGWLSENGEENADMCSWTFGPNAKTGIDGTGQRYSYNMLGRHGTRFYIQQNWDRVLQDCAVQRV